MREETGKLDGDHRLGEDLDLRGTVVGTVTVPDGITFELDGMVTGDLIVETGGRTVVHGTVSGSVVNRGGNIVIYGMVGAIHELAGTTVIDSNAAIGQASMEPSSPKFLRKHFGHEMKQLAFAVVEFSRPDAQRFAVPLQDSALVRGRSMLDFLDRPASKKSVSIHDFLDPSHSSKLPKCPLAQRWIDFISGRLAHVGRNRENSDDFDQWPDRDAGQEKGDDRLERLALLVIKLTRSRVKYVREDCRGILDLIATRAEGYINDPTDHNLHAMDPANLTT